MVRLSGKVEASVLTPIQPASLTISTRLRAHVELMRLDHSIKNIFLIPGLVVALSFVHLPLELALLKRVLLGTLAATLIACSNYVLNEILDAPFDRLHPYKCNRPAARGLVRIPVAYGQWLLLMGIGLWIATRLGTYFALTAAALWLMGCVYNIPPIRTKEIAYLDVLTEAVNNPLRMLLGWYMVTQSATPPASMLGAYWMLGCYFMGLKRFSEYREIGSKVRAASYRRSYTRYSERSLLGAVVFYASLAMLLFGTFIVRYRIELILCFPCVSFLMAIYFDLSFQTDSAVQHPEKLYREKRLMIATVLTSAVIVGLLYVDIPFIGRVFAPSKW